MNNIFITRVENISPELLVAFEKLVPQLTKATCPSPDDLQKLLDSPSILIVARTTSLDGPIIGAGTLGVFRTPSGVHAHVEDVIVDESYRGQGVGETLVSELLLIARQMGLKGVSLTCNPRRVPANRLYQKMGFKKWDTNTYWYELEP
ncbi:MAG: GNAT family N-acetyltransferase [Chloroflexota bacterium]